MINSQFHSLHIDDLEIKEKYQDAYDSQAHIIDLFKIVLVSTFRFWHVLCMGRH